MDLRLCLAIVAYASALSSLDPTYKAKSPGEKEMSLSQYVSQSQQTITSLSNITFGEFSRQYKRAYAEGTAEYIKREQIFKKNIQKLIEEASGPALPYTKGINKFMDYTDEEFQKLLGVKGGKSQKSGAFASSFLEAPAASDAVALPENHDWRIKMTTAHKLQRDQGACGSCWALAAVQALEGHLDLLHGHVEQLSPQFLVSCVPNPKHCGGKGGCEGATAEMAFEYVAQNGIPSERMYPYMSGSGLNGVCNPALKAIRHAQIEKHVVLPENKQEPLLRALYEQGPVVVSVDGSPWTLYSGGVFSGCKKDAIINHAVVAEGFGKQLVQATGKEHKYWILKNSWGGDWGEKGYIRLERHDDETQHCGIDNKPEEGTACEGGPKFVKVCGMCGVLYDSTYPVKANFVNAAPAAQLGNVRQAMEAEGKQAMKGLFDRFKV